MQNAYTGNGYLGSEQILTSVANEEVLPPIPIGSNWTNGYMCGIFEWLNEQDTVVLINNKTRVFIRAGQGFKIGNGSKAIHSFIIESAGVNYNWIAEY